MDHQPPWAAYEKWRLTFIPTRTRGPGSREGKGCWGTGSEGSAYVSTQARLRKRRGRRKPWQKKQCRPCTAKKEQSQISSSYLLEDTLQTTPNLSAWKTVAGFFVSLCPLHTDLICSFPRSQRLGIWDRSKNKLSECSCHPSLVLGFGTELEYSGYLVIQ